MDFQVIREFLIVFGISLVRLTAAVQVAPFLSSQLIQGRVRNSLVISWGLIVYPIVAATVDVKLTSTIVILGLLVKEIVLGILIGFLAGKLFWITLSVGFVVDNQRGASMASAFDPNSNEQTSPLGLFFQQTVVTLFYTTGGMFIFLGGIFQSYLMWPIESFYPVFSDAFPGFVLAMMDEMMRTTLVLAAPIMITVFVAEFGLGLMNRFAPQLNVFFLAMPVKSLVALLVIILYLQFLFKHLLNEYTGIELWFEFFAGAAS